MAKKASGVKSRRQAEKEQLEWTHKMERLKTEEHEKGTNLA